MPTIWLYSLISVLIVSLISLIGVLTLALNIDKLKRILLYMISLSAGALIGDAFIHLLPEAAETTGLTSAVSLYIISGIVVSFVMEKIIHWRHCHVPTCANHPHPFVWMNLFGDSIHNLIDGLVIGASYLVSIPLGIATTLAVILHEIPQEIGDFGILLHSGMRRGRVLFWNVLGALVGPVGAVVAITFRDVYEKAAGAVLAVVVGNFVYLALADLIPAIKHESRIRNTIGQIVLVIVGIVLVWILGEAIPEG